MDIELWREIVELRVKKRYSEIQALIAHRCAASDHAAALVLAQAQVALGEPRQHLDEVVDRLHAVVGEDDVVANLELSFAYSNGCGNVRYDKKGQRSFKHLQYAAKANAGPAYSLAVARGLRTGLTGVRQNLKESIKWYRKAIAQGWTHVGAELQELRESEVGS
jgi:TPR repeat protein